MANFESKKLIAAVTGALPVILSIAALLISFRSYELNAVRSVKPVLIVTYRNDSGWSLRNVGNGPGLNVIVATRRSGNWVSPVRVPPLAVGAEVVLLWLARADVDSIGARYFDIDGRQYTSVIDHDLTTILNGDHLAKWQESDVQMMWELQRR